MKRVRNFVARVRIAWRVARDPNLLRPAVQLEQLHRKQANRTLHDMVAVATTARRFRVAERIDATNRIAALVLEQLAQVIETQARKGGSVEWVMGELKRISEMVGEQLKRLQH